MIPQRDEEYYGYNGNAALQPERNPEIDRRRIEQERRKRKRQKELEKKKQAREKKLNSVRQRMRAEKLVSSFMLKYGFMALALGTILVVRFAYISQIEFEMQEAQSTVQKLTDKRDILALELEMLKEERRIEAKASQRLNMTYPSEEQVVSVKIDKADGVIEENTLDKVMNGKIFKEIFEGITNKAKGVLSN